MGVQGSPLRQLDAGGICNVGTLHAGWKVLGLPEGARLLGRLLAARPTLPARQPLPIRHSRLEAGGA